MQLRQSNLSARKFAAILVCALCCLPLMMSAGGCNIIGALAFVGSDPQVAASYTGLKGQTVAVMVWADPSVVIDHPTLQYDLARALTSDLQDVATSKREDLKGTRFLDPQSVFRFQQHRPDLEGRPLEEIAPILGVSRVIYIEVQSMELRPSMSVDLYKGTILASLRVVEVNNPGSTTAPTTAKVVYEEQAIRAIYPPGSPDGVESADPEGFYNHTVKEAASEMALRFVTHPRPQSTTVGG